MNVKVRSALSPVDDDCQSKSHAVQLMSVKLKFEKKNFFENLIVDTARLPDTLYGEKVGDGRRLKLWCWLKLRR